MRGKQCIRRSVTSVVYRGLYVACALERVTKCDPVYMYCIQLPIIPARLAPSILLLRISVSALEHRNPRHVAVADLDIVWLDVAAHPVCKIYCQ
jgi:hypothetical protein